MRRGRWLSCVTPWVVFVGVSLLFLLLAFVFLILGNAAEAKSCASFAIALALGWALRGEAGTRQ